MKDLKHASKKSHKIPLIVGSVLGICAVAAFTIFILSSISDSIRQEQEDRAAAERQAQIESNISIAQAALDLAQAKATARADFAAQLQDIYIDTGALDEDRLAQAVTLLESWVADEPLVQPLLDAYKTLQDAYTAKDYTATMAAFAEVKTTTTATATALNDQTSTDLTTATDALHSAQE